MCCGWIACSQHFAGLPGGRVGGQDLAPGGLGGQLYDGGVDGDALQPWCLNAEFFSLEIKLRTPVCSIFV